jgi:hypothetical protein
MKKSFLPVCTMIVALVLGFTAKASLPELGIYIPPTPTALPFTVSNSNYSGYIDVDNDGNIDFSVFFSGTGSYGTCYMNTYNSSNMIILENEMLPTAPVANPPLTEYSGTPFTSILQQGTSISTVAPTGSYWGNWGHVSSNWGNYGAPLQASYVDGERDGYIGVHYSGTAGLMYGWLHVQIAQDGSSVTFLSVGSASSSGSAAVAGLGDPYAVPVPLIASIFGFGLIGAGVWFKRKRKK